jgi:MarR family 2-MHQ and catechol resistance regulon transcriptional repressor
VDTSGIHLWLILWKAYEACRAHAFRSIEKLGFCYSDFAVLECLLHKGPLPVNTVGPKVSLTSGSITTAVDRLESRGLVERKDSKTDRRARIVSLTPEGRRLIKAHFEKHERDMEEIAKTLSEKERKTLTELLKKYGMAAAEMK